MSNVKYTEDKITVNGVDLYRLEPQKTNALNDVYGKSVRSNYCPHCGANMQGGNDGI